MYLTGLFRDKAAKGNWKGSSDIESACKIFEEEAEDWEELMHPTRECLHFPFLKRKKSMIIFVHKCYIDKNYLKLPKERKSAMKKNRPFCSAFDHHRRRDCQPKMKCPYYCCYLRRQ